MSMWVANQKTLWWGDELCLRGHGCWWWSHEFYDRAIVFQFYEHKFMNTIEATKRGPHQVHIGKYMEVEGPCHVLLDHCWHVSWITWLPWRQSDFRLSNHAGDIDITQCKYDWRGYFTISIMWLICLSVLYKDRPG